MIYEIYTVYDSAAEAYLPPHFMRSHGEALRAFESAVSDSSHQFHKHAADYTFFHIGSYNDLTAEIIPLSSPVPLARAHEVLARQASAA